MRDSREGEAAVAPRAHVRLTEDGIAWISRGNPDWWYEPTRTKPRRPNVQRIAADTGIPLQTLYPVIKGRPPENATFTALLLFGARRRGTSVETAFKRIFAVVEPQDADETPMAVAA